LGWAQAAALAMCFLDRGKNLFGVPLRLHFGEDPQQLLIRTDEECGPLNPNYLLAVHILFLENTKLFADYFVYICKEGVGQGELLFEFLLGFRCIARDTQNDGSGLLYLLKYIAKATCFDGAARRVGLGVEEKHDGFAGEVFQVYGFVFFGLKREISNFVVHFHEKDPSTKRDAMPERKSARRSRDYSTMMNLQAPTDRQPLLGNAARSLALLVALTMPAGAQYPGHVETNKKAAASVRAVAVLEWTGAPGKPSASRIIPISVFDGEQYQPGGLYLARPEPLALESGTEYVLQDAGVARGLFDINTAQDVEGYWFGYGAWRPMAAPPRQQRAKQGKNMPQVVTDAGNGRPHFKNKDSSGSQDSSAPSGSTSPSTNPPASSSGSGGDPDRPTLRRRSDSSSSSSSTTSSASSADPAAPETATGGADPDRPHMAHGQQSPTDKDFEPAKLSGTPPDLQQMIAVSDASDREGHPFVYLWADAADATTMKAQMEIAASNAIAAAAPPVKAAPKAHAAATTTAQHRHTASKAPPASPQLVFTNERFKAYELTYSGGATLVFSGETTDPAGKVKYVTVIAQPDFNGVPKVLFKSVTDDDHLDQTPKMRLVDAVDARANNRGDLVFELSSRHDREFVIYRVASGQAEQVFTTGSLPNSKI
jgi:hypothetical protein